MILTKVRKMEDKKRDYHREFMYIFNEISSTFTLEKYSEGLVPEGKVLEAEPFSTVWDMLENIEDYEYVNIGDGKYVRRIKFFKKPTRILFLILISEFEERIYRAIELSKGDNKGLNDKNLNDLIRLFFERDFLKLQKEYTSRKLFKEDLKAISSFRNIVVHTNKKLEDSVDWQILI